MPRAQRISQGLRAYLPARYEQAVEILMLSLGPPLSATENNGLEPFFFTCPMCFVRDYGLSHFVISMAAQYELTQRFTAEFSCGPISKLNMKPVCPCWSAGPVTLMNMCGV